MKIAMTNLKTFSRVARNRKWWVFVEIGHVLITSLSRGMLVQDPSKRGKGNSLVDEILKKAAA